MTAAQDAQAESRWDLGSDGYRTGYEDGWAAALRSVAPLLEAARAYRDAESALNRRSGAGRKEDLDAAERSLLEAARTFEGHVEEGDGL